jgi:hypothetical protein
MAHDFRRIAELSGTEFEAEVEKMTTEERRAFYWWLQHAVDQRDATVEQEQEKFDALFEGQEILRAHGFGTPGKETIEDVWHLLSAEDQGIVHKAMAKAIQDGIL